MCIGGFWSGGEPNSFVAVSELDVEERDERLHVVVAADLQVEGGLEGDLFFLQGLDVDLLDETVPSHHLVPVDYVHQGLGEGDLPDGGHIETVDVVPPVDLVVLVLPVLDGADVEGGLVGEHQAARSQPLKSRVR